MLKKTPEVIKVDKLRAILLMEVYFNFINKYIFEHLMIRQCEEYERSPKEDVR